MTKLKAKVRSHKTKLGLFGRIESLGLSEYIGKEIEFEPQVVQQSEG